MASQRSERSVQDRLQELNDRYYTLVQQAARDAQRATAFETSCKQMEERLNDAERRCAAAEGRCAAVEGRYNMLLSGLLTLVANVTAQAPAGNGFGG